VDDNELSESLLDQNVDIHEFINLLVASCLSNRNEAEYLLNEFRNKEGDGVDEVRRFCEFLMSAGVLTAWQCRMLRARKWKGFYLNNYVLLSHIGKDTKFTYYKARDTRNGITVRLTLNPNVKGWPDIRYQVAPYVD
jgi:hypothetical protein